MRFLSSVLLFSCYFLIVAAPTAEAYLWSSFKGSVSKYEIRAAVRAKKLKPRPASVALPTIAKGGLVFGNIEATTTIVMFSDIECPFCRRFTKDTYPTLKKEYLDTNQVRFVIRHFPLPFHPGARPAASAVICARKQSDDSARTLYEKLVASKSLDVDMIKKFAVALKLDAEKLFSCMAEDATDSTIEADIDAGIAAKVAGTPSFIIVGPDGKTQQFIQGAYPINSFRKAIEAVQKAN